MIRERGEGGKTLPDVFPSEAETLDFIRRQVPRETRLYADEAAGWNALHARYELHRINYAEAYSLGGAYHTNSAESFFSRMLCARGAPLGCRRRRREWCVLYALLPLQSGQVTG